MEQSQRYGVHSFDRCVEKKEAPSTSERRRNRGSIKLYFFIQVNDLRMH